MSAPDVFRDLATLVGPTVRLQPLTEQWLEQTWESLQDSELLRLTGTHATSTREQVEAWLRTRRDQHDRADWAVLVDGDYVGEVVLNELDPANDCVSLRIALVRTGQGHGTEAVRLAVAHAFALGLHRVLLEVYAHNPRARRCYVKPAAASRVCCAMRCAGRASAPTRRSWRCWRQPAARTQPVGGLVRLPAVDPAFVRFAEERLPALTGFAARLTGERSTADDLVQEALVRTGLAGRRVRLRAALSEEDA